MSPRFRLPLAAGLFLAVVSGCGKDPAHVSGKVLFDGSPVEFGVVTFVNEEGRQASGGIEAGGKYRVEKAPHGKVRISVLVLPPNPNVVRPDSDAATGKPKALVAPPVPERYRDPDTSELTYEVVPGEQTHQIELLPD